MASLDRGLRKQLESAVREARRAAEQGTTDALSYLGVGFSEAPAGVDLGLRSRLRAHGRQLGDLRDDGKGTQSLDRLVAACAYEHWHRLLFARFLAENDLLVEPETGMPLSLDECRELAREREMDWLVLASDFAQRMLPQIFRAGDPVLEVALPPEKRQALERLLGGLPRDAFLADDSLGWVYQFWQAEQKERVHKSEKKIRAEDLPAVTQLFTEDYMALFLLHNTLGAWWAGRVLAKQPDLAKRAETEEALRRACALPGVGWEYLRFVKEEGGGWRPAAGVFEAWPKAAKDIRVLDPCMGSGHFLVFAFGILVALRSAEEDLPLEDAVDGVLRDNLFGLEIDPRCTQIAAFNLALSAWRRAGHRPLPKLNLACSGLPLSARKEDWIALAGDNSRLRNGMARLYDLFEQAPALGSLINPHAPGATPLEAGFEELAPLLEEAMAREGADDAAHEMAVTAAGMARAAAILAGSVTLVVTNVPYLGRGKQDISLAEHSDVAHHDARADLATTLLDRCTQLAARGGTLTVVTPQNWLFLERYKAFRKRLLRTARWNAVAWLGAGAFETISGEVVNVVLVTMTMEVPAAAHVIAMLDVADAPRIEHKSRGLAQEPPRLTRQALQVQNPDARIVAQLNEAEADLLSARADAYQGLITGDRSSFVFCYWELPHLAEAWEPFVDAFDEAGLGRESVLRWQRGRGRLHAVATENRGRLHDMHESGRLSWGRKGVLLTRIGLKTAPYFGERYDNTLICITPKNDADLAALWSFCDSPEYRVLLRALDRKWSLTNATACKVKVNLDAWADRGPFPRRATHRCTQWTFHAGPRGSDSPLQVGAARMLGYRWPRQTGSSFMDAPAIGPDGLEKHADEDGIVCLTPLQGEPAASARLRALLAEAFGDAWSPDKQNQLLDEVGFGGKTLDDWLRDGFFQQHCELFHRRPFLWHLWDGRRDGFHALVNYHKLAGPNGEGRSTVEKLMYSYLGDWIDRRRADRDTGVEGADARLAAAQHLQRQLKSILEGEPPYDLFVRWKPLHQQPIGWEPDINDGVRLNIRPFMTARPLGAKAKSACILRVTPKIKWDKDRGKEPYRPRQDYPWFWGWDGSTEDFRGGTGFDGNRWNDLHYPRETKLAARRLATGPRPGVAGP